jgi:hypothetical protein
VAGGAHLLRRRRAVGRAHERVAAAQRRQAGRAARGAAGGAGRAAGGVRRRRLGRPGQRLQRAPGALAGPRRAAGVMRWGHGGGVALQGPRIYQASCGWAGGGARLAGRATAPGLHPRHRARGGGLTAAQLLQPAARAQRARGCYAAAIQRCARRRAPIGRPAVGADRDRASGSIQPAGAQSACGKGAPGAGSNMPASALGPLGAAAAARGSRSGWFASRCPRLWRRSSRGLPLTFWGGPDEHTRWL